MIRMLLRVGRTRAAWESGDLEAILKSEFRLKDGTWDFRPSVYELVAHEADAMHQLVVRVHAEHTASFLDPPRKGVPNLDAANLVDVDVSVAGRTAFDFANRAHKELLLSDERDLRRLVRRLSDEHATRLRVVKTEDTLEYIRSVEGTDEWRTAAATNSHVQEWIKLATKRSRRGPQ